MFPRKFCSQELQFKQKFQAILETAYDHDTIDKYLIIAYPRGKSLLKKISAERKMPPENCPRGTPTPRELPPMNKVTLQEI